MIESNLVAALSTVNPAHPFIILPILLIEPSQREAHASTLIHTALQRGEPPAPKTIEPALAGDRI